MQTLPHGTWPSPIDAELTTRAGTRFSDAIRVDGDDVLWVESRPAEGGRSVIVRSAAGGPPTDVTPQGWNVRTRVHEYGGGAFAVADGTVWFSSFEDQRVYRQVAGGDPEPITPEPPVPAGLRYADFAVAGDRLLCVRETHHAEGEPTNEIVALAADGSAAPVVVATGRDFYAAPRPSPDGTRVAWLAWDHPNMPWDGTELWVSAPDGSGARRVMGDPGEALVQPEWAPDGTLHVISDRTGWWSVHRAGETVPLLVADAEIGFPHWLFGAARYAFLDDGTLVAATVEASGDRLLMRSPDGSVREVAHPDAPILSPRFAVLGRELITLGSGPARPAEVVAIDLDSGAERVVRPADPLGVDDAFVSVPTVLTFETPDGPAHA
ncbi:MAG: S9 family peptidase, partial [Acidimicrobiia bacterium]|nr:S9 family peptidase [Acidimicrobiia bacterium]